MPLDCDIPEGLASLVALRQRAIERAVPLHATLALTHHCNFRCVHCYAHARQSTDRAELSVGDWLSLAGEAARAGCLSVLLTGGEPLLRPDFVEIYQGIRRLGLYVTLFTNASLVNDAIVAALIASPPSLIEVSVYGASPQTYERITGRPEHYDAAMRGIDRLRQAGLPVRLKTVLMEPNRDEFAAIQSMGQTGVRPLRYDPIVQPRYVGDETVKTLRIPPEAVVAIESETIPEWRDAWRRLKARRPDLFSPLHTHSPVSRAGGPQPHNPQQPLYSCAAGMLSFYVSAGGKIQPCVNAVGYQVSWSPGSLLTGWKRVTQALKLKRMPNDYPCAVCSERAYCGSCPAVAELETGREDGTCRYACELARLRVRVMQNDSQSLEVSPATSKGI